MLPIIDVEFITAQEQEKLLSWAIETFETNRLTPNPVGPGRYYRNIEHLDNVPSLVWQIRTRIAERWNIEDIVEPRFKTYLSCIVPFGNVHTHKDVVEDGNDHFRCNLFLQLPENGSGRPVVETVPYDIKPRSLLSFTPNLYWHESEVVTTGKRIIISFGFLVPIPHNLCEVA